MIDLRSLALEQLIQRCHTTTVQYLRTHDAGGDSSYCLELFRRALQDHDESAWAFIYTTYSTEEFLGEHYILKWVRSWLHGRHGAMIRSAFTEEEIVHEVWLRFAHSDAARAFSFETMSQLMSYLRRLINNFMMDVARRRAPHFIESSTDEEAAHLEQVIRAVPDRSNDFDSIISEGESMEEMLREIGGQLIANDREWLVFRGYFLERLPPRKLYSLHPGLFAAGEVEVIRTRLVRRLRKSPFVLNRYIQLVVLADDERLSVVFQHAILDNWPDQRLLERYPTLFPHPNDLLAAKVQIVESLLNSPTLLQLLHL